MPFQTGAGGRTPSPSPPAPSLETRNAVEEMNPMTQLANDNTKPSIFPRCRTALLSVAILSGLVNLLMLTGSVFMLEVYDRVIPSRSVPTLLGLFAIVVLLYFFLGVFDIVRQRITARIGDAMDAEIGPKAFRLVTLNPLRQRQKGDPLQPIRDVEQVRSVLSSNAPSALCDLPWLPVFVAICFGFHVWIGITAIVGATMLVALTLITEFTSKRAVGEATGYAAQRTVLAEGARRNAEVVQAMGMRGRFEGRYGTANSQYLSRQRTAGDITSGLGATSKVSRMLLQSAVLAVGAYLVVHGQATPGIMIASSIIVGRAVAPVEQVIANWRNIIAARAAYARLKETIPLGPAEEERLDLPAPHRSLDVSGLTVAPPSAMKASVQNVAFRLNAGEIVGVIGPSGSGKSSLARAIVGAWRPARGKVRLDGAELAHWPEQALGRHIGYLPQDVELFAGTIAENISRFDPDATDEATLAASRAANVHDMIMALPDGYETQIGEGGASLSGGQRQRIGLARALYGDPFLLVLDEPNASLDADGERALSAALMAARARGGIAVVIAHRPSALAAATHVLSLSEGLQVAFGPKDEVLAKVLDASPQGKPRVVASMGGRT